MSYLNECLEFWSNGGIINWIILGSSTVLFYFCLCKKTPKWFINSLINIFPLIGLLGTVVGMVQTFQTISSGNLDKMSIGISKALITTMSGLFISLLAIFIISFKKNKK